MGREAGHKYSAQEGFFGGLPISSQGNLRQFLKKGRRRLKNVLFERKLA